MRIGSLCSGYGGLEVAIQAVYGGTTAWVSDIDKGACKILAHRFPGVPNLGDFTKTDWADVEPVDLICAGFPCQPVSHAGKRLGDEDERWLWDDVLRAVREVRPGRVVLENVRGLLTARDGELFGRVLGSLADIGYDAGWHGIKAAEVGAPHNRFRVFIVAGDTSQSARRGSELPHLGATSESASEPREPARSPALLPSPRTSDTNGAGRHGDGGMDLRTAVSALPMSTVASPGPWGRYAAAIHRWESLTRPAPPPTEFGSNGNPRLAPAFSEWMMGLPAGWVTDVPGITRNEALRALGNGVVPQQCAEALRVMATWQVAA